MTDINLEHVSNHDDVECAQGMKRLRDERDDARRQAESARMWAIEYERDALALRGEVNRLTARLAMYESHQEHIDMPPPAPEHIHGQEEIGGVGV